MSRFGNLGGTKYIVVMHMTLELCANLVTYVVSYIAYPVQTTFQCRQNSSSHMVVPMDGHVRQNAASLALLLGGTHTLMAVRWNWLCNNDVRNSRPSPKRRSLVTFTSACQQLCVCSKDFKLRYNRL